MIWEELKESLIEIGMEAKSSQDVFRQLGGALTKEGYTKASYVEALAERERNYPTGLDIHGIGVAIPHTDVSHVNQSGIAIAVLKEPVTFIQMATDDEEVKVKLVFMLSVVDPDAHLEELKQILAIIQDEKVLDKLTKVKEKQEMINIIKEKEITL